MNDFLGGNNYQQTDEQLKAKKMMKVVGVILVLLLIVVIVLIALMYYIQSTQLKISLDGQTNNALKDVLIIQDGKVYVPIRAFAQYVGYESANGDYKQYEEDTTKCYVENANEVASFSLDSNTIYKIVLDGNNDYEYYEIEEPVVMINNQLCTTNEGARIAFNLSMAYDQSTNQITIFTLPYLVTYYTAQFQNAGIADDESSFSNQKALLYNMIVVKNEQEHYGVYGLDGNEILGIRYADIKFVESTKDFVVTTLENKMGIMSYDSTTKIRPEYDEIKQIDKDNGLYLATNNGKQGVVNENGSIIIYLEYDQIGIDGTQFEKNNVKNQYLLYDNCIPVRRNNTWDLYDKTGNRLTDKGYTAFGCTRFETTNVDGTPNSLLLVPQYEGIVVQEGEYYGLIDSQGNELLPSVLTSIYLVTNNGQETYEMIYNEQRINVISYIELYVENAGQTNDEAENNNQTQNNENQNTANNINPNNVENTNTDNTNDIQVNITNNINDSNTIGDGQMNGTNNTTQTNANTVRTNVTTNSATATDSQNT